MQMKIILGISLAGMALPLVQAEPIDRHALVTRHTVVLQQFDTHNPLYAALAEQLPGL